MKLEVEKWVEKNDIFESIAKKTFDEAVLCYKVGAYKSAFIMSYLSFKLTIKQRIIQFDNNSIQSFQSNRWNNIIEELNNDDKWEERLNKEIICKETSSIIKFTNRDKIILDYEYWRNIRNSCVHAKGQIIDASTVECFWNYLKDNLSKFYVLGGKEYIRKEFLNYFRYFKVNEENRNLDKILNDVSILYSNDTKSFFSEIITDFKNEEINLIEKYNSEIWKSVLEYENTNIKEGFLKYIKEDYDLLVRFCLFFSDIDILVQIIQLDKKFIVDGLNKFLKYVADYYHKHFLDILYKIILLDDENIEIDSILNKCNSKFECRMISMIEFLDENQRLFLMKKNVFKKIIEISYKWIYEVAANLQYDQFYKWSDQTEEVVLIFKYINFDIELLKTLDYKIGELSNSIKFRSNENSVQNGTNAKNMFEQIIKDNRDKITKLIDNSDDDFHNISNTLNNIESI